MKIEFEIKFYPIALEEIIEKLVSIGAMRTSPRTFMRRATFEHPLDPENAFARIRDEGDRITCTYKYISPGTLSIESVKEIECEVSDFESMRNIFIAMNIHQKSYQETYREVWEIPGEKVYFMLDEWPGLQPFIEIESESESKVREYVQKLGFVYENGFFGGVDVLCEKFLGLSRSYVNTVPEITFANPLKEKLS